MQAPIEPIIGRVEFAFSGLTRTGLIGSHEVEPKPVAMPRRETTKADMAHRGSGLAIEGADIAPALRFRL